MQDLLENPGIRSAALRIQVDQYHRLCSSGIIPERTELLEGVVVAKMGKSPLHTWTVAILDEWFRRFLRDGLVLRVEQPLTLGNSEPEPDLAVVAGHRDDFRQCHPSKADLVVEVAITTVELDHAKAGIYAAAGIPMYLLVLPEQQQVIVFDLPQENRYFRRLVAVSGEQLCLTTCCHRDLDVRMLFPESGIRARSDEDLRL